MRRAIATSREAPHGSARSRSPAATHAGSGPADGRRRIWRRQRPRHRARRCHPLAGRAPDPDRCGGRDQHGRPDRGRLRHRNGSGGTADVHHDAGLGSAVRRVDVQVQEHPAQDRRPRVSIAPRVRPQRRGRAANRPEHRPGRRAAPRPHRGAVLRHAGLRRPADAVPDGGRRSPVGPTGRDAAWVPGRRHARHDVAAAHLSAHRNRRTGAHRRRHHEQRAGGHRESDGREPRDRRQRRRSFRSHGRGFDDARRRGGCPRRDDARVDQARARLGGRRRQRARCRVWFPRLAAGARVDRGGLPGGRGHARSAAAPRRQRGGVRCVAPRPPGPSPQDAAAGRVHRARRLRHERHEAPECAPGAARGRAAGHRRPRSGPGPRHRAGPV